jgi:preprotein translocase subunit SecD
MQRSLLIRTITFSIAIIVALLYLAPTFVNKENLSSWWTRVLPVDRINLGLDLQGGTHLILQVKADKAIENNIERIKDDLTKVLRESGVSGASVERQGTRIALRFPSSSADRMRALLKGDFGSLTEVTTQTGGATTELALTLSKQEMKSLHDYAVDQSLETIRNRVDQFGVSEPIIQREGQEDILVQLPGIQDPERAKEILGKTALLEFKLVDETASVEDAIRHGPPPGRELLYGRTGKGKNGVGEEKTAYVLESPTLMTGATISDARVRPAAQLQSPYVELNLSSSGARLFEQITAANVKRRLAIVLDDRVYSAPVIQERIAGGRASITGSFTLEEARDLAIILRAGALPAPVVVAEERTVGPSLGSDSIHHGIVSFVVGSALVILFMVFYYRGAGLLADLALIFHVLFLLAILASFKAVLTLPGIAGIVLIAGMAVDANVLINERIREELRLGKRAVAAVQAGFQRALPAIIDTNVTTFLSGVILYQFGTGPIKGFAVTLCVGILTTVVTAVLMTRMYYDYRIAHRSLTEISI